MQSADQVALEAGNSPSIISALKFTLVEPILWAWVPTLPAAGGLAYLLEKGAQLCGWIPKWTAQSSVRSSSGADRDVLKSIASADHSPQPGQGTARALVARALRFLAEGLSLAEGFGRLLRPQLS